MHFEGLSFAFMFVFMVFLMGKVLSHNLPCIKLSITCSTSHNGIAQRRCARLVWFLPGRVIFLPCDKMQI